MQFLNRTYGLKWDFSQVMLCRDAAAVLTMNESQPNTLVQCSVNSASNPAATETQRAHEVMSRQLISLLKNSANLQRSQSRPGTKVENGSSDVTFLLRLYDLQNLRAG